MSTIRCAGASCSPRTVPSATRSATGRGSRSQHLRLARQDAGPAVDDILDPNRAIDNNYFSYTLVDKAGTVATGIISAETSSSVTLKQPEGKTLTVLRSDIEQLKPNGVSLMPVGFEKQLTVAQMADVISFVKNWRYLDGSVPKEVIK